MPWKGRGWEELSHPLKMLSHDHVYTATLRKVLLTDFSWRGVVCEIERRKRVCPVGALFGLLDTEDPPSEVGKP